MGVLKNVYKISVRKYERKTPLERSHCRWEGNIKIEFKDICIVLNPSGTADPL
jgi:hypothetical protein